MIWVRLKYVSPYALPNNLKLDHSFVSLYVCRDLRFLSILPSNNMYLEQEYICIQMAFVSIDCI